MNNSDVAALLDVALAELAKVGFYVLGVRFLKKTKI